MRQVPYYIIIGNGRVANHLRRYLTDLSLPFTVWHRALQVDTLAEAAAPATHVLLAIRDDTLSTFIQAHPCLSDKILVHFSGCLSLPTAYAAHPLFSFSAEAYDASVYRTIPFIIESGRLPFDALLPGFANPHFSLDATLKPLYHALCVMSGNFTVLLWQKVMSSFETTLNLPKEVLQTYQSHLFQQLIDHTATLTGPLSRREMTTVQQNINALENDPYQRVYQAFVTAYEEEIHEKNP